MSDSEMIFSLIGDSLTLESGGKIGAALKKIARALTVAESSGEPALIGKALVGEAWLRFRLGQYAQSSQIVERALPLLPENCTESARAWVILGNCAGESGDLNVCEERLRRAADICRETGSMMMLVGALHNLCALIYMPRGQFKLSIATDLEALRLIREHKLMVVEWGPLVTLSWIYWQTGQRQNAENAINALRQVMLPNSIGEGYYHIIQGNLHVDAGRSVDAAAHYAAGLAVAEACGDPSTRVSVRLGMSRMHRLTGDFSTARHWANDALTLAARVGYHHMQGAALIERGRAAWRGGDLPGAEADLLAAIEILSPNGFNYDLAAARLGLAALRIEKQPEKHRKIDQDLVSSLISSVRFIKDNGLGFTFDQERAWTYSIIAYSLDSRDPELLATAEILLDQLKQSPLEPLRIILLGGLQIWRGEKYIPPAALKQRRAGELLALLALAPNHLLSDDQAAEALAPDKDRDTAKQILYHASSTLRRALEPELTDRRFPARYLVSAEGSLKLNLPPDTWIDYPLFEEAVRSRDWQKAYTLYQGDFLPEFRYAEWAITKRESLALGYAQTLLALTRQELAQEQWNAALDFTHQLISRDPWNEEAVMAGMQACLGRGDVSGARRLYLRLVKTLRDQLAVDPQPELQQFYREISIRRN